MRFKLDESSHMDHEPIVGRLWIVDEQRIRIDRVRDDED